MQENVHGIVLRTVKYGESSLIVDLFTKTHGRLSVMTSITRTKRAARTATLWQPLTMVEFSADIRQSASKLPRPTDASIYYSYSDLPFSPVKSSLALFIAEFLSAALREEKENTHLYNYIESSLQWLDAIERDSAIANFHLVFLMHLSRFVGIYPNLDLEEDHAGMYFDLSEGAFRLGKPQHSHFLRPEEACKLQKLFRMNYSTMHLFRLTRKERQRILTVLNEYYRLHIPLFPELKSLEVLKEMFD